MSNDPPTLKRTLHMPGALLLGLGAVVGTGAYVTLGLAVELAGSAALMALGLAAAVAFCNGQSSAWLAARHPISGGTYVYAGRELHPWVGFLAGWLFLAAKSASAATAALGIATYLLSLTGVDPSWRVPLALGGVAVIGLLAARSLSLSVTATAVMIAISVGLLVRFSVVVMVQVTTTSYAPTVPQAPVDPVGAREILYAAALIFVAFTGYGRVATLGEEVVDPARTIPRAVGATVFVSGGLYLLVMSALVLARDRLGTAALPETLAGVAHALGQPTLGQGLVIGATVAMLGVLLNLVLGLSRVLLAMARAGDMPMPLARIHTERSVPVAAVMTAAIGVGVLVLVGDIRLTWSFSALTVLLYYGVTNLAALSSLRTTRGVLRWVSAMGLLGCLALAFFIPADIWILGGAVLVVGVGWRGLMRLAQR